MKKINCMAITVGISILCNVVMVMSRPDPKPQRGAPPGAIPIISYIVPNVPKPSVGFSDLPIIGGLFGSHNPGREYGNIGGGGGHGGGGGFRDSAIGHLLQAFVMFSGLDSSSRSIQGDSSSHDSSSESDSASDLRSIDSGASVSDHPLTSSDTQEAASRSIPSDTSAPEPRSIASDASVSEPRPNASDASISEPRSIDSDASVSEPRSNASDASVSEPRSIASDAWDSEPRSDAKDSPVSELSSASSGVSASDSGVI